MKATITKQLLLFILSTTFFTLKVKSQDVHFSQFFETQMLRNPALTGVFTGDVKATLAYRSQWNSFTNAYKTGFGSIETKFAMGNKSDYLALGAYVVSDKSGSIGLFTTHIMPTINYFKSVSNNKPAFIGLGFSAGIFQRGFDASKITTNSQYIGSQYVPSASIGENFSITQYSKLDIAFGVSFNTQLGNAKLNNFYIGAGFQHFNKPNVSFYNNRNLSLAPKINLSTGYKFELDDYSYFTAQADFTKQSADRELLISGMYSRNLTQDADGTDLYIHAGIIGRIGDAIIPVIKIDVKKYTLGFSYDANLSNLTKISFGRGGYECTITYKAWRKKTSSDEQKVNCPKF